MATWACLMYHPVQLAFLYSTMIVSMLLGASVVHSVLKPNLALPALPARK